MKLEQLVFPGLYLQIIQNFTARRAAMLAQMDQAGVPVAAPTFNGVQAQQLLQQAQRLNSGAGPVSIDLLQQIDFPALVQMLLSVIRPATLGDIHRLLAHACHALLPAGMLKIVVEETGTRYEVDTLADFGAQSATLVETILGFFYFFQRALNRNSVAQLQLYFKAGPTQRIERYRDVFECGLGFRAPRNEILFPRAVIDLPVSDYEYFSQAGTSINLFAALTLPLLDAKKAVTLTERARGILLQSLQQGFDLDREALAQRLAISVRSLTRKLEQEGVRFKALQSQVRIEVAQQLLASTDRPLATVARQAGFQSEAGFSRAFRKLTGVGPLQFRMERH